MGTSRKKAGQKEGIKCLDCRVSMIKSNLEKDNITFEGYQCPSCKNTVLTIEQLKIYNELRDLKNIVPERRKIVKIGNSLGITFPSVLKNYGMKMGEDVEIKVLDSHNLHIKLC